MDNNSVWHELKAQNMHAAGMLKYGDLYNLMNVRHFKSIESAIGYQARYGTKVSKAMDSMEQCMSGLTFREHLDGTKTLVGVQFCKDRLCPICNWRRSLKFRHQMSSILKAMEKQNLYGRPLLIAFSINNIIASGLNTRFGEMGRGFANLLKHTNVRKHCIGAARVMWLKYNTGNGTYGTHMQCLFWIKPGYFTDPIPKEKWAQMFRSAAFLPVMPEADICEESAFSLGMPETNTDSIEYDSDDMLMSMAMCLSESAVLPGLYVDQNTSDAEKLDTALRAVTMWNGINNRKLVALYGKFKKFHDDLGLDSIEDGDLINIEN